MFFPVKLFDITAGFQCFDQSPTAVTFRGEIGPSLTANSSQLISYLEQWVATDPTIVVLSSRLSVDSSCSVEISNFNDPECSDMTSTSTKTAIIGGGVGGVFVILVATGCSSWPSEDSPEESVLQSFSGQRC